MDAVAVNDFSLRVKKMVAIKTIQSVARET